MFFRKLVGNTKTKAKKVFKSPFRRSFVNLSARSTLSRAEKVFYVGMGAAAVFGVASVITSGVQKSQQRIYGQYSPALRARLSSAYGHVVGALASTALYSVVLFRYGALQRMARFSPLAVFGGCFLATIGSCIATQMVDNEQHPLIKFSFWTLFNLSIAFSMCPLVALSGDVLLKAALGTAAIVGSMSAIAASAPSDSFLKMGTGLGIGFGVLLAASVGQLFFPSPILHAVTLYGGLGLFSLFTLYDTQFLLKICEAPGPFDPINASMGLYLNVINIFVRMAMIFAQSNGRNK